MKMNHKIRGYGKLKIGDSEYNFENMVNSNFLSANMDMVSIQGLTRDLNHTDEPDITRLRLVQGKEFSLMNDSFDSSMQLAYDSLANIPIENFKCIQSSMYKTTIRGSGTITKSGNVKSAGFNVLKRSNNSSTIIELNTPFRFNTIPVEKQISLSSNQKWIYYPKNKALYQFARPNIFKLHYDIETGEMGELTLISTQFDYDVTVNATNGKDKYIATSLYEVNVLLVFDFETETTNRIMMNQHPTFGNGSDSQYVAWDNSINGLRCVRNYQGTMGYTITMDGLVTLGTGAYEVGNIRECNETHIVAESGIYSYSSPITKLASFPHTYPLNPDEMIFDDNNVAVLVTFDSLQPSQMNVYMYRKPDTSLTLFEMGNVPVSEGQEFSIDYTFEVLDER